MWVCDVLFKTWRWLEVPQRGFICLIPLYQTFQFGLEMFTLLSPNAVKSLNSNFIYFAVKLKLCPQERRMRGQLM